MLARLVITFLPRSKRLLISWLQSPSSVILEPPKIKSDTVSTVYPSISHEVMGPDAMILVWDLANASADFRVALTVKNSPANAVEVRTMGSVSGREDPLEEGIVTHSSILAWRIPWTVEPGLGYIESQRVQLD